MAAPISPLVVAQVVARNIVPLAGIVFFHWSAANVLLLYFLDTMLAIAVIAAGFMATWIPTDDGWASRVNGEVGAVAMGLFLAAFIAVPLGVPIIFVLGPSGFHWREALADGSLGGGALMQAVAAFWSYWELWKALRTRTVADLRLKRRFTLVFLRWMATLMVIYTGVAALGGPLLVVATYVVVSIWSDVAPDRFLRAMPGGAEDADPEPGAPPPNGITASIERFRTRRENRKR
ncbi:MAG: hypothetical protein ABI886_18470 [Betaproteobacteria bacterium]